MYEYFVALFECVAPLKASSVNSRKMRTFCGENRGEDRNKQTSVGIIFAYSLV